MRWVADKRKKAGGVWRCRVKIREVQKRYIGSEKGLAANRRYEISEKRQVSRKRYDSSEKGQVRRQLHELTRVRAYH